MNDPQLVPLGAELPATTTDAERSTSGSALLLYQTDAGAIHASLRFARIRRMRVEFTLDVVNATDEPLLATIYAVAKSNDDIPVAPYAFWIDRRTEAYLDLPLSWLTAFTCRAISVRLQGRNAHQRLEAAMPRPSFLGWFAAGALLVAIAFALFLGLQPRVINAAVPAAATAGSRINVSYAFAGSGAHEWEILDLTGARIDGGALSGNTGTAAIPVPRVSTQTAYAVRLRNSGAFGDATAERPLIVNTPRPSAPPPRISSLTLDDAQVTDGTPVTVRYRVSAQYGDILATDAQGTIWAQQPLNANGVTVLPLPRFGRNKELQIRLVARRADAQVSSGLGLSVVVPTPSPAP